MKHLLIPTDFSAAAETAFRHAIVIACKFQARITLLHIAPNEGGQQAPTLACLRRWAREVEAPPQLRIELELEFGDPAAEIADYVERQRPDLVVLGIEANEEKPAPLGAVSNFLLEMSTCPLMMIPEGTPCRAYRHLMYAATLHESDLALLDQILPFSARFGARTSVVHVEPRPELVMAQMPVYVEAPIRRRAHRQAFGVYHFAHPNVAEGLDQFTHDMQVDMIALLAHPNDVWDRWCSPALVSRLLKQRRGPLLIFQDC